MKKYVAVCVLVLAVLASYAPAVRDGFVWDDTALVLRDPLIRSWRLIPEGFNHFLFVDATASDFYRPIQRLTYTLEYALFTVRPGPYHITSIALHAAAAVALFFLAETMLAAFGFASRKRGWVALSAALVWAIHPVQSAAVVYVSGRADPLAALFGFFGCYLALRSLEDESRRKFLFLIAAGALFLLSALSKETGLVFPLLAIGLCLLLKKRAAGLHLTLVAAFVCTIYLSLRLPAEHIPPPPPVASAPLLRPITMARAFAEYAGLLVLPLNLHMDRKVEAPTSTAGIDVESAARRELQTLLGICLLAATIFAALHVRRRSDLLFALFILAGISYLPVSGLLLLNASVAEHWLYVPSAFFFLAVSVSVAQLIETDRIPRALLQGATTALACWLAFLGTRTFFRTFDWRDQRTFLERTIANGGDSARMLINLGGLELSEGHLELAQRDLRAALKREPDEPLALINLAIVALKHQEFPVARKLLTRASTLPVVDGQAHELLAVLENKEKGRADLLRLRLAAHTGLSQWSIEKRYIKLLDEVGATPAAIHELQILLQSEWYRAESWQLLSQLFLKSGHLKEAAQALACADSYDVHLRSRPAPL